MAYFSQSKEKAVMPRPMVSENFVSVEPAEQGAGCSPPAPASAVSPGDAGVRRRGGSSSSWSWSWWVNWSAVIHRFCASGDALVEEVLLDHHPARAWAVGSARLARNPVKIGQATAW